MTASERELGLSLEQSQLDELSSDSRESAVYEGHTQLELEIPEAINELAPISSDTIFEMPNRQPRIPIFRQSRWRTSHVLGRTSGKK